MRSNEEHRLNVCRYYSFVVFLQLIFCCVLVFEMATFLIYLNAMAISQVFNLDNTKQKRKLSLSFIVSELIRAIYHGACKN